MEDKVENNNQEEQQKEKRILKNKENLRNILDYMKRNNTHVMGIPEEKSEQGIENLVQEIMTETSLIWWRKKSQKSRKLTSAKQVGPKEAYTEIHHN